MIWKINQFSNDTIKECRFACASLTNNDYKVALLHLDVEVLQAQDLVQCALFQGDLDVVVFYLLGCHVEKSLAYLAHAFGLVLVGLVLDLFLDLIFVGLVEFGRDTPGEVALDLDGEVVSLALTCLFLLNETFLALGRAVKSPQLFHTFHHAEVLAVKMLTLANSVLDALKHHSCQGQLAQCECVSEVNVDAEGGQAHETRVHVVQKVVNFGSKKHFVFELNLFLVDFINLLNEIWLPTK